MKATIDRSGCIGCGLCADTCSALFRMGEDGLAQVFGEPTPEIFDLAKLAEENCPVGVIEIKE